MTSEYLTKRDLKRMKQGLPVSGRPETVGPMNYSRSGRNVALSPNAKKRIDEAARRVRIYRYKKKYKIFWRIALRIDDMKESRYRKKIREAIQNNLKMSVIRLE